MVPVLRRLAWCAPWIFAVACTSRPEAPSPAAGEGKQGEGKPGDAIASLEGRVFLSQVGVTPALLEHTHLRLSFEEGSRIDAFAGCNRIFGRYAIEGDTLMISAGRTKMGCGESLEQQEVWYLGFLQSTPTLTVDGDTLVLEGGGTRIEYLDREKAPPDVGLAGHTWMVDTILTKGVALHAAQPLSATLTFTVDGRVEIYDGCNKGRGTYEVNGKELTFTSPGPFTKMYCEGPLVRELERAVRGVLGGPQPVTFSITDERLSLRDEHGTGLDLKANEG